MSDHRRVGINRVYIININAYRYIHTSHTLFSIYSLIANTTDEKFLIINKHIIFEDHYVFLFLPKISYVLLMQHDCHYTHF